MDVFCYDRKKEKEKADSRILQNAISQEKMDWLCLFLHVVRHLWKLQIDYLILVAEFAQSSD